MNCPRTEDGVELQKALGEITKQRTVPSVFIGGEHVGGCDGELIISFFQSRIFITPSFEWYLVPLTIWNRTTLEINCYYTVSSIRVTFFSE